ncbi:hypothetical protein [Streptomyces sp. NPDC046909]|uniref:hypothetical protein n=1 Tax=Streptomyces sp. NPDC046909 TaxID=3155617 RepID=UPI0033C57F00
MALRPEELWSRFDWRIGSCFRCEQTGVPVAEIGDITVAEVPFSLYACQRCVFRLEQLHWTMRERAVRLQSAPSSAGLPPSAQWSAGAPLPRPPAHVA